MGKNGIEAKTEGEMQAVVVVRQIWNHPVIPSQKDKNENGFELAGKACDDAAREVCNGLWCNLLNSCQMHIMIHASNKAENWNVS